MDLKALIKKRGSFKAKLTQFKSHLQILQSCESLSSLQINELNVRLTKIEELYSDFDYIQTDIENVCEIPDEQYKEREIFESQYFGAIAVAREMLTEKDDELPAITESAAGSGTVSESKGGQKHKLPTIKLPSFSGQYHDWLEFRNTYTALIHSDDSLPQISKFHYLRAALHGSSAAVIDSLDFTPENYEVAWNLLCERFNNKRALISNHVQAIFNIEQMTMESADTLLNIIDTVNKNLRCLKSLGLPTESWDVLVIEIVSNKFDQKTSREWEMFRSKIDIPSLVNLRSFLKDRADFLASMKKKQGTHTQRRHSDITHTRTKSFVVHTHSPPGKSISCALCKHNHAIYHCFKFKSLPIETRIQKARALKLCLNCLRHGHNTNSCKFGSCKLCNQLHHTLLHLNEQSSPQQKQSEADVPHTFSPLKHSAPIPSSSSTNVTLCATNSDIKSQTHQSTQFQHDNVALTASHNQCVVLLSTALIQVQDHNSDKHTIRALLDNGSTSSFITESLCKKLKLPIHSTSTLVEGLNNQSSCISKQCNITISSLFNSYMENISCFVVPHITQSLPTTKVDYSLLNIPKHITLADPTFHIPSPVDMLLGADLFWSILCSNNISLGKNKPTLSESKFGFLVSGPIHSLHKKHFNTVHCNHSITHNHIHSLHDNHFDTSHGTHSITHDRDDQLHSQLAQFFELEAVTTQVPTTKEEQECELNFTNTTLREPDGRFNVTIPLKNSPQVLGDSYEQALHRFISLERRFKRDPLFKHKYTEFIREYISLGHMTENTTPNQDHKTYIMPHHGVLRENSLTTQLRVVFDGSARTSNGLSFNNIQRVGPVVQNDLISILIRFRQHKYVVTADVEKMYRMVNINESQRMLQQILWRFEPHEQLKQYKLNTVTYGTACAPYLATRCLAQLGKECSQKPVADAILQDFYVDDFISGADSIPELVNICRGVITQLESGQFHLRKWHSNNSHITQQLIGENSSKEFLNLSEHEYSKTLGLLWACKEDKLLFSVNNLSDHVHVTKRTMLSTMAQIFDPLGLINPCILQAKLILQTLWSLKIAWDDPVPIQIQTQWFKFVKSLTHINNIKIPRHITCEFPKFHDIHTFSDASTLGYSACVYLRSIDHNNQVTVHLITAKSRVAPLKPITVPRLELCGALLAARLTAKVKTSLRLPIRDRTYWCDSIITLSWIRSNKANLLKQFVYNRIHEINTLTESRTWRYVPTHSNPADIGSRGADAKHLESSELWWSGPSFLLEPESNWPAEPSQIKDKDLPEFKVQSHLTISEPKSVNFIHKFSEFSKLQRVTGYVLRFIHNTRNPHNRHTKHLSLHELHSTFLTLCRIAQLELFPQEYKTLQRGKQLSSKHSLLHLAPFFHTDNLIRVGGRLANTHYEFNTKHPILLHASHHLTMLLFKHYHKLLMHSGPQLLLANIRHKVWPLNGRNLARKTVHNCNTCCRFSGRIKQPIMGNLPKERCYTEHPFINTSLDYMGPIMILNRRGRGSRLIKSYVCVFVCMAIRAVHVELVTDLSTDTFLAALNRFIARRGKPANIFSDNGLCFVGACNELSKFLKLNSDYLGSYAANLSIKFNFSPAYSPHFNGLAEGAVKSVKHHLKRILAYSNLTYEEMNTVLTQIEAILNSRPLIPLSSNPSDLTALTPSHFLLGRTITVLSAPQVQDATKLTTLSRYSRIQQLKAHFWDRYYKEYITELQRRQKWRKQGEGLQLGEMVLVKDDRVPPNRWLLGRVTGVYPGSDGVTRVADVKTTSGTLRRAFNRLCPLPVPESHEGPAQPTTIPGRQLVNA